MNHPSFRPFIFVAALFVSGNLFSQSAGEFQWALRAGGEGNDKIRGTCATVDGGVFVTGEITGDTDFGPHKLKSAGSLDFVLAKINQAGDVIWAVRAGGKEIDRGYAVSPDSDGGCYVTGHFQSETISFGEVTLTTSGDYDGFIARFDDAGKCLWAKRFGGKNYDFGHGISTAPDGNVVVSGTVANVGDIGGKPVGREKSRSAVVSKFSPDGDLLWVSVATGPGNSGHNVTVGRDGAIYLAAFGRGEITWSDDVSTTSKIQDVCLAKYNADGEFQWVQQAGGESNGAATGVSVDEKTGNICLSGMFKGIARFGDSEFTSHGGNDFFAAVYSSDGDVLNAHHGGGQGTDYALGSTTLRNGGGFVITGEITESANVNGKEFVTAGERDAYILELSPDGGIIKSFTLAGGKDHDLSYAIATTTDDGIVISGAFRSETKFGATSLTAKNGNDIFVARFQLKAAE